MPTSKPTVMIATHIEPELIARIEAVGPPFEVLCDPAMLPPPRFPSDHRGIDGFTRAPELQARWERWLEGADILYGIPGDSPAGLRHAIEINPKLTWIQATSAGAGEAVRTANLDAAALRRVTVTTAAGVHGSMLAEFAFGGIIALRKDFAKLEADKAEKAWLHYPQGELRGETLVVVGMGHIGTTVARIGRAFGMRVVGVTRTGEASADADTTLSVSRIREACALAEALVVTLPLTERTRRLIDRDAIAALPENCIVVNVGRGAVIDEEALIAALEAKRIRGAALDVFATEPLPEASPLWTLPNVILSPHTAALSTRENARIVELFCENLARFRDGKELLNVVDTQLFY